MRGQDEEAITEWHGTGVLTDGSTVLLSGIPFTVDYTFDGGGDLNLNDVALIAQIPEPSTPCVVAGSLALLTGLRRFRRRA